MAWGLTVAGVSRKANVNLRDGVEIVLPQNERGTARFTTNPGYVPALRSEVVIYDTDGTTPLFGGVLFQRSARGMKGTNRNLWTECECADWTWYLDRITIPGGSIDTTFITLKDALTWIVDNLLAPYGFTLHPSQATGPSGAWQFSWDRKYVSEILRDLTKASGGWVWSVDPSKRLRMIPPTIVTPSAPFGITDSNQRAHELTWVETSDQYATRIILRCGGEGTKEVSETWTVTAADVAAGYIQTTAPSIPTGPVSATVNASPVTIGTSGTQLIWNWSTHRITPGTLTPVAGNVIVLTYTAQYPFEVIEDGGVSPPIELVVDMPDLTDPATAANTGAGLLVKHQTSPRTYDVVTFTNGLRPGQVLSIDSPNSSAASTTALITEVRINLLTDNTWRHKATAVSGIYQGSALDYFRGLGGGSTGSAIIITTTPGATASFGTVYLGGSRNTSVAPSGTTFVPVPEWVPFVATQTATVLVRVEARTRNAGVTMEVQLWDLTTSAQAGLSGQLTSTTETELTFTADIVAGRRYQLRFRTLTANQGIFAIGNLEAIGK